MEGGNKMDTKKIDAKIRHILIPAILENAFLILSDMILTGYIGRLTISEISAYGIFQYLKDLESELWLFLLERLAQKTRRKGYCIISKP